MVLLRANGFVLRLISPLIRYAEVFEVPPKIFELEMGASIMDAEVDDDMVVGSAMLLFNHVIKSLKSFIAVLNCHFNNLVMLQFKFLFWSFRILSLLSK